MRATKHKNSSANTEIKKLCEELNYDPLKELIQLAQETMTIEDTKGRTKVVHILEPSERIAIAREVAAYLHSKFKGVELPKEAEDPISIVVKRKTGGVIPPRDEVGRLPEASDKVRLLQEVAVKN